MTIFIDAGVFCAYANADDVHHANAKKVMEDIASEKYGMAITTDYIFDETITVALRKSEKKIAIELGSLILNSEIFLAKVDSIVFKKAWEIFQKVSSLSFTDCTNVAFMQIFGIQKIATFDKGFSSIANIQMVNK